MPKEGHKIQIDWFYECLCYSLSDKGGILCSICCSYADKLNLRKYLESIKADYCITAEIFNFRKGTENLRKHQNTKYHKRYLEMHLNSCA